MNKKDKKEAAFYRMTVSEAQLNLIHEAMEEYFRLRMGQETDFCNDLAEMGRDLSPNNPNHKEAFDRYIIRRNHMQEIMRAFFRIAFEPEGYKEKTEKMLIAEDIWDVIRVATGRSRWGTHLHTGPEPSMLIEKVGAEKE